MAEGLVLTGPWKSFLAGMKPERFAQILDRNLNQAQMQNAEEVRTRIQDTIKSNMPPALKGLSIIHHKTGGKWSTLALVDTGGLWRSINIKRLARYEVFIGLIKGARGSGGGTYQIGAVLHEGCTIKVTARMRAYFRYLAAKTGGNIVPLRKTTTVIVIPPRPFITKSWDGAIKNRCMERYKQAVSVSLRQMAAV